MTTSRLSDDDAPYLKKGQLKALIARGVAKIDRNNINMVKVLRARLNMSQAAFAKAYCLSIRTVQQWEQGRYRPDPIARNLLRMIDKRPALVRKLLKSA
ncbi:MAG: helix-turn-helix domain-containing protein [Alphaproteobacteria bacterium]|nr:helix-turn-helix domain-containing protein [Alphaproteobacteria bacterium]